MKHDIAVILRSGQDATARIRRITIVKVIENEWFKKGYKPPIFANEDVSLDDVDAIFNKSRLSLLYWTGLELKLQAEKTGRKGHLFVATEIYEMSPSLCMVELRKVGGDTLEFHKFYKNLATGLKDIVWKSGDETKEEANDG
ncbi:CBL-interacting serine/threonine-protein kinase 23 [Camellia lanceoleosa]|uniref:CBL-interacting serine/threonine-protein kinase 23 n=1 Tax=Camellia lanceoleosa TaxID=1840588 RepID=A0ACC0F845_9ERIC|nr:CBL-interacting serine/threonine-protein kinase 23 [Camellia lanceoleosa]